MVCQKEHRYNSVLETLPPSQAGEGRHKCTGCAYEEGFTAGFNGMIRNFDTIVETLPESQAGSGRHKDPEAAYDLGYEKGRASRSE